MSRLGNLIRRARRAMDYSQEDIARLVGVERSYIGHIESGRTKAPGKDILKALSKELHIPLEELLVAAEYLDEPFEQKVQSEIERLARTADAVLTKEELESLKSVMRMILSKKR